MRRFFETDAVIIAALVLVAGTYKLATSDDVQAGFVRLVQQLRDVSDSTETATTTTAAPAPESGTIGLMSSSSDRADSPQFTRRDSETAGIDVLPPASPANLSPHTRQSPSTSDEQLAQAVARGRERLAKSRVRASEFADTFVHSRSCSLSSKTRLSCRRIQ